MRQSLVILLFYFFLAGCSEDLPDINNSSGDPGGAMFSDKILYSKNPKGHNQIYLLEGSEEKLILSDPKFDFWWTKVHPDRSKFLVYRSPVNPEKNHDDYENAELLLVDIDGSNPEVIIRLSDYGWKAQGVCRWNMDGSKILMCADVPFESDYQWRMISTTEEGTAAKTLSHHWALDCNFSVDNTEIVFMGFTNNLLDFDLTSLKLQRGAYEATRDTVVDIVALTDNSSRDHDHDYVPDNKSIVFYGGSGPSGHDNATYSDVDLLLCDIEKGEERIPLDDSNANGGSMCWSKDGEYVVFRSLDLFNSPF